MSDQYLSIVTEVFRYRGWYVPLALERVIWIVIFHQSHSALRLNLLALCLCDLDVGIVASHSKCCMMN